MRKIILGVAMLSALVVAAAVPVGAFANDDGHAPVRGPSAQRAKVAALAAVGGGRVHSVHREREHGVLLWEVTVVKKNGRTLDVHLNPSFKFVGLEDDSESENGE